MLCEIELRLPAKTTNGCGWTEDNPNVSVQFTAKTNSLTIDCTENAFQIVAAEFDTDSIAPIQATPPVLQLLTRRATYPKFV